MHRAMLLVNHDGEKAKEKSLLHSERPFPKKQDLLISSNPHDYGNRYACNWVTDPHHLLLREIWQENRAPEMEAS